jgi:outer membrane receptor protein involved in Fe transport
MPRMGVSPNGVETTERKLFRLTLGTKLLSVGGGASPRRASGGSSVFTRWLQVLRLASNLHVSRAGSSSWAISARGFNNTLANKLLVMIDGRAVYTPLFAGVFWDAQHVMLEDIERIEVVSGPGGTLWGANAVNGVINVITKSAKDTQGTYLSGAAGSFMQDFGAVRYGGGNGSNLFFRVYAQRYDLDIQHRLQLSESHRLIWGGGYRLMRDRINNTSAGFAFLPADRNLQLVTAFIQDDIIFVPDRWRMSLGAKFEHNDYSGFEFQPGARVAWTPHRNHTLWSAVSRAVRTPSRVDTELFIPAPPLAPGTPNLAGGPGFESEDLLSLELGYRVRPFKPLWMSVTAYYNFYDDLRSLDQIATNNFFVANHFKDEIRGVEVSAEYTPATWWRIRAGYNFLHKNLWAHGGNDPTAGVREGNDPDHQFTFHSIVDLPGHCELDVTGRYVDSLPSPRVPGYVTLDARLAWQYRDLEISLVGQNLVEPRHREFGTREIPRSIYGMITLRF